jgi:hypothetical protein
MATVLANTPNQLVVAAFGRRLSFTSLNGVTCSSQDTTDTPENVMAVLSAAVAWIDAPTSVAEFGPVFGEKFKFFTSGNQQAACYAVHDGDLGVREDPKALRYVMSRVTSFLTDHGI